MRKALSDLKTEHGATLKKLDHMEKARTEQQLDFNEIQAKQQAGRAQLEATLQKFQAEAIQAMAKENEIKAQCAAEKNEIKAQCTAELETVKEEKNKAEVANNLLHSQLEKAQNDVIDLKVKVAEHEKIAAKAEDALQKMADLKASNDRMGEKIAELTVRNTELEQHNSTLKSVVMQNEIDMKQLKYETAHSMNQLKETIHELEACVEKLESTNKEQEEAFTVLHFSFQVNSLSVNSLSFFIRTEFNMSQLAGAIERRHHSSRRAAKGV